MAVIEAATLIAHQFASVATPTQNSWLDYGSELPYDVALTFWRTPAGFGWQMTIYRQEAARTAQLMCDLTCEAGSAQIVSVWGPTAEPYLGVLAFDLTRRHLATRSDGKAVA